MLTNSTRNLEHSKHAKNLLKKEIMIWEEMRSYTHRDMARISAVGLKMNGELGKEPGTDDGGSALCAYYLNRWSSSFDTCSGCPVARKTQRPGCRGTNFREAAQAYKDYKAWCATVSGILGSLRSLRGQIKEIREIWDDEERRSALNRNARTLMKGRLERREAQRRGVRNTLLANRQTLIASRKMWMSESKRFIDFLRDLLLSGESEETQ